VRVRVDEEDVAPEELDELTRLLREELTQLDVTDVVPDADGAAPEGTRGPSAMAIGSLLVTLAPTAERVGALVRVVMGWLGRGSKQRTVRLEVDGDILELTGTTSEMQQKLADEWIRLHSGR
jgi:hypothetical protein